MKYMNYTIVSSTRTSEQIKEHYKIEKELAKRLIVSSRKERVILYKSLYDELYQRIPNHPQLSRKTSSLEKEQLVISQLTFLKRFLDKNFTFLEIGAGDCALSLSLTKQIKKVYAVEVSEEITEGLDKPLNFQLILTDGLSIPVPKNSIDIAYSNQLMEHLHPDDAFEQLQNIYNSLVSGGIYICVTPNRLNGPHDISKYFDQVATGFHLKEYTLQELNDLFKKVGFSKTSNFLGARGIYFRIPIQLIVIYEWLLEKLPYNLRKKLVNIHPLELLLDIRLVGVK